MILRRLCLYDFGLYQGPVSVDLAPRKRGGRTPPIILIGGGNGFGKTTLFEAVRLALYGRRALGARVSQDEYNSYLRGRIHQSQEDTKPRNRAHVELTFDYAEAGQVTSFSVKRGWQTRGATVNEVLEITRNGEVIHDIPKDEWEFFLQDLIPPGVSDLFFFDGERIQEIATSEEDEEQLAHAIRALLGIELVSQLRTDLGVYLARQGRIQGGEETALERIERQCSDIDEQLSNLHEMSAHLRVRRDSEMRAAERARHRFTAEGGEIASRRDAIEKELADVTSQRALSEAEVRDHAAGLLPFAIAPRVSEVLRGRLSNAARRVDPGIRSAFFTEFAVDLSTWLEAQCVAGGKPRWTDAHRTALETFIQSWMGLSELSSPVLPATPGQCDDLLDRLLRADAETRPRLRNLTETLDRLTLRQNELEGMLSRANSISGHLLLEDLQNGEQRLGAVSALLQLREGELAELRTKRRGLDNERQKVLANQANSVVSERRTALAAQTLAALGIYEHRLLQRKLETIRGELLSCLRQLMGKDNFIGDVRIDPVTFSITLIKIGGNKLPKSALSAGEKQVYATAMLWALARASGRPLPMIIDTPLARLDSEHRHRFVTRYLPAASHQVVVLSTDTELNTSLLDDLRPFVSHSFMLAYDPAQRATTIKPGYFRNANRAGEQNAIHKAESLV